MRGNSSPLIFRNLGNNRIDSLCHLKTPGLKNLSLEIAFIF